MLEILTLNKNDEDTRSGLLFPMQPNGFIPIIQERDDMGRMMGQTKQEISKDKMPYNSLKNKDFIDQKVRLRKISKNRASL